MPTLEFVNSLGLKKFAMTIDARARTPRRAQSKEDTQRNERERGAAERRRKHNYGARSGRHLGALQPLDPI